MEIHFIKEDKIVHLDMHLKKDELDIVIYVLELLGFVDAELMDDMDKTMNKIRAEDDNYAVKIIEFNPPTYEQFLKLGYFGFYSGTMNYCNIYVKGHTLYLADINCGVVHFYKELNEENYNKVCELARKMFLQEIMEVNDE